MNNTFKIILIFAIPYFGYLLGIQLSLISYFFYFFATLELTGLSIIDPLVKLKTELVHRYKTKKINVNKGTLIEVKNDNFHVVAVMYHEDVFPIDELLTSYERIGGDYKNAIIAHSKDFITFLESKGFVKLSTKVVFCYTNKKRGWPKFKINFFTIPRHYKG